MNKICCKCGKETDLGKIWFINRRTCCFDCITSSYEAKTPVIKKIVNPITEIRNRVRKEVIDYIKLNNDDINHPLYPIVGCTSNDLRKHLELKFTEGMTWENRGYFGWHVDHIIPLCSKLTENEIYNLCRFTNLQPLWRKDNYSKRHTNDRKYQYTHFN